MIRNFITAFTVCTVFLLGSCMVDGKIVLDDSLSGRWDMEGRAMAFAGEALDDLAMLGGFDDAAMLYDDAMNASRADFGTRDDIQIFEARRTGGHSWEAHVAFEDLESLLGRAEDGGIVSVTASGGLTTLELGISRANASSLEELVPLMTNPALSLFNPAQTAGIDEETYIRDILGFTFGEENIPAIRSSRIRLDLELPGPVTAVEGGRTADERTVVFEVPFSRLMTPDEAVQWSVTWSSAP